MNIKKLVGIVLVTLGVIFLVYRGFNYTSDTHKAKFGPLDFTVKEKKHVDVPVWAGVAAVVVGVGLLVLPGGKRR
jgi:drug/metabolite transporter (DMT)-like permease